MALFFAKRIIDGKTTFARVPQALRSAVAEILVREGHGHPTTVR